jgi:hypothetical protein
MSSLLLCAGVEPNPGPRLDDISNKIDDLMAEMKAMRDETKQRLDAVTTRLVAYEAAISEVKADVVKLKSDSASNATTCASLVAEVAAMKNELSALSLASADWPILSKSSTLVAGSSSSTVTTDVAAMINDVSLELKRRVDKECNVIVFGLQPRRDIDDVAIFTDLIRSELDLTPHITKTKRLGDSKNGKPPPLLVCLRDTDEKRALLVNAKKLRKSANSSVKDNVFINADLTLQQRQQGAALRRELKARKESGEVDIVIRSGKIVHQYKKE